MSDDSDWDRNPTVTDARNYETMLTLGRVLYAALSDSGWQPDIRARTNILADPEPFVEAYNVLEGPNPNQALAPETMAVLAEFDLTVAPIAEDKWNSVYAEYRLHIPDEVRDAYEQAAEAWGPPDAPKDWSDEEATRWSHETIMAEFAQEEASDTH